MILASHIVISGLLGAQTQNYFLAAVVGLISHYVVDGIPHWDHYLYSDFKTKVQNKKYFFRKNFWLEISKILVDIITGLSLFFIFWNLYIKKNIIFSLISITFGILPDFLQPLYWITKWRFLKWNSDLQNFMHYSIHSKIKQGFWPGIIIQIATMGTVVLVFYFL